MNMRDLHDIVLEDDKLELRRLEASDFEMLYAAASDPKIWEQHPDYLRYQRDVFTKYFAGAMEGAFIIFDKHRDVCIGSSRLYEVPPNELTLYREKTGMSANTISIGYTFLTTAYWGGQYNPRIKAMMLVHAFKYFDTVVFQVAATNMRSRTAVERLGAQLIPISHPLANSIGGYNEHIVYELKRPVVSAKRPLENVNVR